MQNRTDLAFESYESANKTSINGVIIKQDKNTTIVEVINENGAKELGKPIGKYITYSLSAPLNEADIFNGLTNTISDILRSLLPNDLESVLVAGIGNPDITADALGPRVNNYILPTRHIKDSGIFNDIFPISSVSTGVLGDTGIESAELVRGIVNEINPSCVIAVDALAAGSKERLATTIQLSNNGIAPGSGVGNHRFEISKASLGIPVIAIGIPTVVSTSTLDSNSESALFVTPREIDKITEQGAKLIGMAINTCFQKGLSLQEILSLVM